ncbi:MAG: amino acid racemase [Planctomycetota bacterium]|nr:amino acid racemase [Planctomycetota bacterium]
MSSRLIGILGGLGPDATVDFLARVLRADGADTDQEHVRMIVACDGTIPNRNLAIDGAGPSPGPALAQAALRLERAGADVVLMICNAAHHWQGEIERAIAVPFVSLIEEAADRTLAVAGGGASVGVLAAHACHAAELYPKALRARDLHPVLPDAAERAEFMRVLAVIKAGDHGPTPKAEMRALAHALVRRGATTLLAGCTEIGIVLRPADVPVPMVDTTEVLVQLAVALGRGAPVRRGRPDG